MAVDKEWLFNRRNIRRLRRAADDAAEGRHTPRELKNYFIDLENVLDDLENALRRHNR
jgi:hypothetical protein